MRPDTPPTLKAMLLVQIPNTRRRGLTQRGPALRSASPRCASADSRVGLLAGAVLGLVLVTACPTAVGVGYLGAENDHRHLTRNVLSSSELDSILREHLAER